MFLRFYWNLPGANELRPVCLMAIIWLPLRIKVGLVSRDFIQQNYGDEKDMW